MGSSVNTHQRTPLLFKRFYWQVYRLVCKLRTDVWIISTEESMKGPLSMLYIGHEINKNYLARLAFDGSYRETYIGRMWLWTLVRIIKKESQGCFLMVLEVNKALYRLFLSNKSCFIPLWL